MKHDMLFIRWTEAQALGIPIIDEQHRITAALINTLYFMLSNNLFKDSIVDILRIVVHHMRLHNFTEEYLLEKMGYDAIESHKQSHKEYETLLADAIRRTKQAYEQNATKSSELLLFLKSYWMDHICKEDHQYKYLATSNT